MNFKKLLLATTGLLAFTAHPAAADPLTTAIGALMSTAIGTTGATVGSILGSVAFSIGSSYLFNVLFGPETKQRGVKNEVEFGAGLPPAFIFGTYATPGVMVYENVWDGGDDIPNQCLTQVIALSFLPVKGIKSMLIAQDERVNINLSSNHNGFKEVTEYIKGASGGGYFLVKFLDGTQNSVDPWLLDKFGDHPLYPIDEDCWWRGCALVILQCWYSNLGVWTGWPETKWEVEGISLYDARKDSTVGGSGPQRLNQPATWGEAPSNAKVVEMNFILGIKYKGVWQWGGKDTDPYRLPLSYWFAAMNACDEDIALAGGGTVKRGHIGGEIRYDDDPREIIAEINKSVNGYTTLSGGFYKTWCGTPGLSVMTITDDDFVITQDRSDELYGREDIYNTGYGYYADPRNKWEMKDTPRIVDADALEEDGTEKALDVQLPFVTHWQHAQRAIRAMIKDSRRQVSHRGILPPEAYVLEPFDRVNFISVNEGYGGSGKAFRIDAKEDLPNVRQDTLLREINPDDTGWLPAYELEDSVGNSGNIVADTPNLGLVLTADEVTIAGGKERPAIKITWPWAAQDTDVRRIYWKIRLLGTSKVIAKDSFRPGADGEHFLVHPSLRYGRDYEIAFEFVYHTPRFTNYGSWGAITMLPAIPDAPVSLTAVGRSGRIVLTTTKSADKTFDHWNLYASSTNDFTTATLIDTPKGTRFVEDNLANAVTRYYWLAAEDKWGHEGPKFPVSNTGGRTATTVRVADDDIDTTPPSTPTISMTGYGGEYDDDGGLDAGLAIALTNPNTGPRITDFMVKIQRSPNDSPGSYVDWRTRNVPAEDVSDSLISVLQIGGNTKFWHRAKAWPIGYNKRKGTPTAYTTPVKPNKYTGYTGQSVSAPGVVPIANGYVITASLGSLPSSLFKEMEILVGGVTLIKVPSLTYQDMTARTAGATPTITVKLYDKVGGVTSVSSGTVAPAFRRATAAEVGSLGAGNLPLEPSGIIMNPTFTGGSNDGWDTFDPTYTFIRAKGFAGVPADAPADYVVEFNTATYATDAYWKTWTPVEPGEVYYVEALLETDGLCVDNFIIGMNFKDINLGAPNSWVTGVQVSPAAGNALATWTKFSALVTVPTLISSVRTGFGRGWFSCRGNASPAGKWYGTKFRVRKATEADMLAANAVTSTKIADGAVITAKIADAALTTAKFASTIKPVEIFATLPTTGNADGRQVFLTTDKKLYRYSATLGAFTKEVDGADIKANSIIAGQIAAGAVGAAEIAAGAVNAAHISSYSLTAANATFGNVDISSANIGSLQVGALNVTGLGDLSNMVKANTMVDASLFTTSVEGAASAPSIVSMANANGDLGASKNKLRLTFTATTSTGDKASVLTATLNPCVGQKRYTFSAACRGVTVVFGMTAELYVDWYSLDASGAAVFLSTAPTSSVTSINAFTTGTMEFAAIAPATAAFFVLRVRIQNGTGAAGSRVVDVGSFSARMSTNSVLESDTVAGTQTIGAGNTATVMSITSHHTKSASKVTVTFGFKNASGGTRAIAVEWQKVNAVTGTTSMLTQNISMQDDNPFYWEFLDKDPAGDETTYNCRITAPAGNSFLVTGRFIKSEAALG